MPVLDSVLLQVGLCLYGRVCLSLSLYAVCLCMLVSVLARGPLSQCARESFPGLCQCKCSRVGLRRSRQSGGVTVAPALPQRSLLSGGGGVPPFRVTPRELGC